MKFHTVSVGLSIKLDAPVVKNNFFNDLIQKVHIT
jgi:hypothetical protein